MYRILRCVTILMAYVIVVNLSFAQTDGQSAPDRFDSEQNSVIAIEPSVQRYNDAIVLLDQDDILAREPVGINYCLVNDGIDCSKGHLSSLPEHELEEQLHQYARSVGRLSVAILDKENKFTIRYCTGTVLDSRHLVTAYHCLQSVDGKAIAAKFRISYRHASIPALRGKSFGVDILPVEEYTDADLDIAVLKLADEIPIATGLYAPGTFRRLPQQQTYPFAVSILGHPSGAPAQWISGCVAEEVDARPADLERYLLLSCNTEGGLSGAPIYGQNGIIGFHNSEAEGNLRDFGVRSKGVELETILGKHPTWGELFGQEIQPTPAEVAAVPTRIRYASDFTLPSNDLPRHLNHYQYAQGLNSALQSYGDFAFYSLGQDGWINITFQTTIAFRPFLVKQYYDGRGLRRMEMRFEDQRKSPQELILAQAECVEVFENLRSSMESLVDPVFNNEPSSCPTVITHETDPRVRPNPLAKFDEKPSFKAFFRTNETGGTGTQNSPLMPVRETYLACNDETFIFLTLDNSRLSKSSPSCSVSISNHIPSSSNE